MVKAKKFVLVNGFNNMPKEEDFKLVEEDLLGPQEGEFLAEALYLSVDPYMRAYAHQLKEGKTMIGVQVARILESNNKEFPVGKYVVGNFGWSTHTISNGLRSTTQSEVDHYPYVLPDIGQLPPSLGLGVLGLTGNTAYFGFTEICKPRAGETVVVTTAAGAVGSHVGQIAKIKGCRVIGITGSDEKCLWLKSIGFDAAINYKNANWINALSEATPRGIDCYFDNVGGEISSTIIQRMCTDGRVAVCGSISSYNCDVRQLPKATMIQPWIVFHQLEIKGFVSNNWSRRWMEGIKENLKWVQEGRLRYKETITDGFENMPKAFIGLLKGENIGKAIVKV
uniref:Prostaglandin reductase 1 n=2 Tax=Photinus pyralis TaxID=7054 RepID=A0A1Y1MN81_PHOPY